MDRASHVVDQLLTMARIQPEHAQESWQQNDLHQIAADVAAELVPLAAAKTNRSSGGRVFCYINTRASSHVGWDVA